MSGINEDAKIIESALECLPTSWDGQECILQMKERNFQWKQMEWIGWYFEMLCRDLLVKVGFDENGDRYGKAPTSIFDFRRSINWDAKSHAIKSRPHIDLLDRIINWDAKSHAIKSDSHNAVLNDKEAMDKSVEKYGAHGAILALLDVEYNDESRVFQAWHNELKGGISKYEEERIRRNASSRYRKRSAQLCEILLLSFTDENKEFLGIYKQGRNSNGSPRPPKYMLDITRANEFQIGKIIFPRKK